jgi:hypothetical protein
LLAQELVLVDAHSVTAAARRCKAQRR